jgi:RNase P subunit RPR2
MVYILNKGTFPRNTHYTMHCRKCRTTVTFEQREGRIVHDQRDGDAIVFDCPVCHTELWHHADYRGPTSW